MASISAVIVAGGKGERMQADIRKQYLVLDGLPILSRTLLAFTKISVIDTIYLVIPEDDFDFCTRQVISPVLNKVRIQLVAGGEHRQASVYNGLSAITEPNGIVAIHDGVRPFVPVRPTEEAIRCAEQEGACILGIPVVDTLKNVDNEGCISNTMQRVGIWQAQTPQVFQYSLIKKAHDHVLDEGYTGTDDASLVEYLGSRVKMIYGSPYNIKITKPEDLIIARGILSHNQVNA
ncbi:MAG: 2-C-methyl-D-erythritol 4-phosphate cytidylyltransferase [Desulfobacteraceae bacterium]|nr:2-C-methyl-D-erythritol 4-phosphate cytidylyltransferase [Desulfobacteraceae bacterium]MBC2755930.1 2-C-methyl-D-erythritol 4-phosphate cytidylyltransferase [Desulfobacteraceae bacterium]